MVSMRLPQFLNWRVRQLQVVATLHESTANNVNSREGKEYAALTHKFTHSLTYLLTFYLSPAGEIQVSSNHTFVIHKNTHTKVTEK